MSTKKLFLISILLPLISLGIVLPPRSGLSADLNGKQWDRFGSAVALSQKYAAVGAPANKFKGDSPGSIKIYTIDGDRFVTDTVLVPANGHKGDLFGTSLAIDNDRILVGAPGSDEQGENSGVAYLYEKSGGQWSLVCKLTSDNGQAEDLFGTSVALSGNYALVGAPMSSSFSSNSPGYAILFSKSGNTWKKVARLQASDGGNNNRFGSAVALTPETICIGAPHTDSKGINNAGAVYIYTSNSSNWQEAEKLVPSAPKAEDNFGAALSLDGNQLLVGAPAINTFSGTYIGYATLFHFRDGSWQKEAQLMASDDSDCDRFGTAVALLCNVALIGAPLDDEFGEASGSMYVFQKNDNQWSQKRKFAPDSTSEGDQLGFSVALSRDKYAVGVPGDGTFGEDSGHITFVTHNLVSCGYDYYIPAYISGNGNWIGLGLKNLSQQSSAAVTVTVFSQSGTELTRETITIPKNGQKAKPIAIDLTAKGWLKLVSSTPLAGLCFLGTSDGYMADIPVVSKAETFLVIPLIAQDDSWDTKILVCNPNETATTLTLIYKSPDGQELGRQSYPLKAWGSSIYPLSESFSNLLPLSGSIQLQATPGITAFALYSNTKTPNGHYFAGINAEP
jgi:hypothetical protein